MHKRGSARTSLHEWGIDLAQLYTIKVSFLPRKPVKNTLKPLIDPITGDAVPETVPFMVWDHEMYLRPPTLQAYRLLIYTDIARALLAAIGMAMRPASEGPESNTGCGEQQLSRYVNPVEL